MKIFQESKILNAGFAEQSQKSEKPGDGNFDNILKETMGSTSKAESGTSRTEATVNISKIRLDPLSPKNTEQLSAKLKSCWIRWTVMWKS